MNTLARILPIFTALAIAAIAAVFSAGLLVRLTEARSLADVTAVLRLSGFEWARVTVDGLQVRLSGQAPTEALRFRALSAAGTVVDAARVIDEIAVAEKVFEPPRFSIEILRNDETVSLIGLIPKSVDREELLARIHALDGVTEVTDLLDTADHPVPEGWDLAIDYGISALDTLGKSKISIAADLVRVTGSSDNAAERNRLEADLARRTPDGLRVALDITAPRPAITPFLLRFLIDATGRARFDACSADTAEAREAILKAAVAAGMEGKANCTIGLGAPSPRWGEAAVQAIRAVQELGGGTVTISDADVALVAPATTPRDLFDTVVGTLERRLPDAFSLQAVLTEPVKADGSAAGLGPPEFFASRNTDGQVRIRGRVHDPREQAVVGGYVKALFGVATVTDATRIDPDLPEGWSVRVLAAIEALRFLQEGSAVVQPDLIRVQGVTGLPDASADISRLLTSKLGEAAQFEIAVSYDPKLDPVLNLPSAEECVADINAAIAARKISFAPGSAEIEDGARETLDKIAGLMKLCADYPMEIGGHTDSQGREEMNQALSQARAEAVIEALVARRVLTGNLTARGYGEAVPIADNKTEEGREANRRIEFRAVTSEEGTGAAAETDEGEGAADAAGGEGADSTGNEPD